MNACDVLKYGSNTVHRSLADLPYDQWEIPDVCGWWSVKHIVAHLASFEHVLVEVLSLVKGSAATPLLDVMLGEPQRFNDEQVAARQDWQPAQVLADYDETFAKAHALASALPAATFRETGAIPWYGAEYDLDDFLAYTFYGHKREHCAQINVFRDAVRVEKA